MSLKTIKDTLEAYLVANITDVVIKRFNTTYYTLNGASVPVSTSFIEAKLLPLTQDRYLMSSAKPIDYRAFFQIDIYDELGDGMGATQTIIERLDVLFREHIEGNIVCEKTNTLNSFASGNNMITPYRVTVSLMEG
jgi:hypothetical protein